MTTFLLSLLVATASPWDNPNAPPSLNAAHAALLDGKYVEMFDQLRITLQKHQDDEAIRENALGLLQKAYELTDGHIPTDFRLPPDVTALRVAVARRGRGDVVEYNVRLAGETIRPNQVSQLQLIRHPDTVVLDRRAGIGEWEETVEGKGGEFELTSLCAPMPIPDGLYRIVLQLDDGTTSAGDVILSEMVSSQTPRVSVPSRGQRLSAPVQFRWEDFRSPEHKVFEKRGLWLAVARMEPPAYDWEHVWSRYIHKPSISDVELGADAPGNLRDGRYVFVVNYSESRRQGGVSVRRTSVTTTPFHVLSR